MLSGRQVNRSIFIGELVDLLEVEENSKVIFTLGQSWCLNITQFRIAYLINEKYIYPNENKCIRICKISKIIFVNFKNNNRKFYKYESFPLFETELSAVKSSAPNDSSM